MILNPCDQFGAGLPTRVGEFCPTEGLAEGGMGALMLVIRQGRRELASLVFPRRLAMHSLVTAPRLPGNRGEPIIPRISVP